MGTTPKPSDSDQHRAVSKNGRDHIQDKEIRALSEQSQLHHEEFIAFTKQDLGSHRVLDKTIEGVRKVADSTERKLDKYTFTGKVLWGLATLLYSAVAGGVGWVVSEIGQTDDAVRDLGAQLSRTEATDASLRGEIDDLEQDLRDLRRLVQQHQINKREHNARKDE